MALSKPIVIKHHFPEWNNSTRISLLITGKSAVGKSSLVNALVGKQVAEERHNNVRLTADKVTAYDADVQGVKIRVWDSPGLRDDDDDDDNDDDEGGTGNDETYLAEIESKITEKLDVVIFCLKMDDKRFYRDKDTLKIFRENFGKELWKNAVIALTFANKVEDPAGDNREVYFEQDLANWQEVINSFLSNTLKLDPELVQSLPIVPTGYYRQASVLPNGGDWLSEFWIACYNVARSSTSFRLHRIKNVSFWKKIWETIKEYCFRVDAILGVSQVLRSWLS